jgi:serralysin
VTPFSRRTFAAGAIGMAVLPKGALFALQMSFIGCIDFKAVRRHLHARPPHRALVPIHGTAADGKAKIIAAESAKRRADVELAQSDVAVSLRQFLWPPGSRIGISFLDGTVKQRQRVMTYAPAWSQYSGVPFAFLPTPDGDIRISFAAGSLSYSAIGQQAATMPVGQATMTLAQLADDLSEAAARGLILHEFGHALGLVHEHQNPVNGIPWNRPAAMRYFGGKPYYLSSDEIEAQILTPYGETLTNHTAFDGSSIMVYPIPAEITDGKYHIVMNTELSPTDKSFIAAQYRR